MAPKLGEYVLQKPIGRGAMGQVWLAVQESLDRQVAVKVLPKDLARDPSFRARFEREAKIAASLIHPNVIQVYSFGIQHDVPYFAMEYVQGEDLGAKLRKGRAFTIEESVRMGVGVARALECAHEKNMVHRDIKPGNIMITKNGTVKVMDFGLAKATSVQSAITQPGLIMGTPSYMSPEQGMAKELDVRSDMYSLGIVLYKLLTGRVPFEADTPTAVVFLHIYEPPKRVRELNPEVPEALERIVMKLLEKKPDARYPGPAELITDLEAFLSGSPVTGVRPVGAQPQPAMRTEAIGAGAPQPTAVTEPLIAREQDIAAAPTMAVGPPAGYVKTREEEVEFLEDLLQGDDPGTQARAPGLFEKDPGLRDSYARQLFAHALLRSQVDARDRVGRNKRITRVLSMTGGAARAPVGISAAKVAPMTARRKRSPLFYYAVIGGIFFILAAVLFMLLMPSMLPEAALLMTTVRDRSPEDIDRTYKVSVTLFADDDKKVLEGGMHARGLDKWVAKLQYGSIVAGYGKTEWVKAKGYVFQDKEIQHLPERSQTAAELPRMSMGTLLAKRGEFFMRIIRETELPAYPGRKLVEVLCTAIPGRAESKVKEATYWVDREKALVMRAVLKLAPGPIRVADRTVEINYTGEESLSPEFYNYGTHSKGKPLYSHEAFKERGKKGPGEPEFPRDHPEDPW